MKLKCGKRANERWRRISRWHRWFAWYPVKVGHEDCRWLEWVERRFDGYFGMFLYRPTY